MNTIIFTEHTEHKGKRLTIEGVRCTGCVRVSITNTDEPKSVGNPLNIYGDSAMHVLMEMEVNMAAKSLPAPIKTIVRRACLHLHLDHIHQLFGDVKV